MLDEYALPQSPFSSPLGSRNNATGPAALPPAERSVIASRPAVPEALSSAPLKMLSALPGRTPTWSRWSKIGTYSPRRRWSRPSSTAARWAPTARQIATHYRGRPGARAPPAPRQCSTRAGGAGRARRRGDRSVSIPPNSSTAAPPSPSRKRASAEAPGRCRSCGRTWRSRDWRGGSPRGPRRRSHPLGRRGRRAAAGRNRRQEHDAVAQLGAAARAEASGPATRTAHRHRLPGDLAADHPHLAAERRRCAGSPAASWSDEAAVSTVHRDTPNRCYVGPALAGGSESEPPQLPDDVRRRALQARTRRVPAHHRIVGQDLDLRPQRVSGDRFRRPVEGSRCLQR